ncbi:MAG: hypothetical protein ABIL47_07890, partial [candidate division WOR-3 bacterium]
LNRYFQDQNEQISIIIIPLCCNKKICKKYQGYDYELAWNILLNSLLNNSNFSNSINNNYNGIIFYSTEEIPRGDYPESIYNTSRMIREFFENTTYAKTANYENITDKIKELLLEIKLKENK